VVALTTMEESISTWYVDFGATQYICHERDTLKEHSQLTLYIKNKRMEKFYMASLKQIGLVTKTPILLPPHIAFF